MKTQIHFLSSLLTFVLLITALSLNAQEPKLISITDPGELYSTYNFTSSDKEMLIKTFGQAKFDQINASSHESQWPSGISSLEDRTAKREQIMQYKVQVMAVLGERSLIEIAPASNKHMPADMLLEKPFYFVIGNSGIAVGVPGTEVAEEYLEDFFPQVSIDDPGQILSNYRFSPEDTQVIKEQVGDEGYDYINLHCREENFPAGMRTLSGRLSLRDQIMKFNAFLVAECDDFSIIEITPEENTQMPADLTPDDTFYLVIKTEGISIID